MLGIIVDPTCLKYFKFWFDIINVIGNNTLNHL